MAKVVVAMERYRAATRILASRPGRIKERLAVAVREIEDCQDVIPVIKDWNNSREENLRLWRRLNSKMSPEGVPGVQARIESMTEAEACEIADTIYIVEEKLRALFDSSG